MWGREKWLSMSSSGSDLRQYNGQVVLRTYYATAYNKFKEIRNSSHILLTLSLKITSNCP
jgi:hypothetical protein